MRGGIVDDETVIDAGTGVTLAIYSVAEHLDTVDTILLEEVLAYCVRVHIRLTILAPGLLDSYGALRYGELSTVTSDDELRPAGVQSVVAGFRQYDVVRLVQVLAQLVQFLKAILHMLLMLIHVSIVELAKADVQQVLSQQNNITFYF